MPTCRPKGGKLLNFFLTSAKSKAFEEDKNSGHGPTERSEGGTLPVLDLLDTWKLPDPPPLVPPTGTSTVERLFDRPDVLGPTYIWEREIDVVEYYATSTGGVNK